MARKYRRRTKHEKERDLALIQKQYLRGFSQQAIAEKIGISQQQISKDLKILMDRWRDSQLTDTNLAIQMELQRINELEQTHWTHWEKSLEEKTTRTTKQKTEAAKATRGRTKPAQTTNEAGIKTEESRGDTKHLDGVKWCIKTRIELLGLMPSQRAAGDNPPPIPGHDPSADPRLLTELAEFIRELESGNAAPGGAVFEGEVLPKT